MSLGRTMQVKNFIFFNLKTALNEKAMIDYRGTCTCVHSTLATWKIKVKSVHFRISVTINWVQILAWHEQELYL